MRSSKKWRIIGGGIAVAVMVGLTLFMTSSVLEQIPARSNQESENMGIQPDENKLGTKTRVIASFYPLYDYARNVGKEKIEVSTLIPIGIEPHLWEPTAASMQQLRTADIFIYNGAGFEPWVEKIIVARELTGLKSFETTKGIKLIKSTDGDKVNADGHEGTDPHLWLDPILAKHQVNLIKDALIEVDPLNTEYYVDNAETYIAKLDKLDAKIRSELASCKRDTFISFHQAFSYFANRYGLIQVSLAGINPEAEASPAELKEFVEFARTNDIKVIYSEELINPRLAEILAAEVGAEVLLLSPIEGLTNEELGEDLTYLDKMEQNLQNLKIGLECT